MDKKDLPQDDSSLVGHFKEVNYVKNTDGKYEKGLSSGWDVKSEALNNAWEDIEQRKKEAKESVKSGDKSPIFYFMELKLMDFQILSAYTGFWSFTIKRHLKPSVFKKMSDSKLQKYADAFEITLDELKNFKG